MLPSWVPEKEANEPESFPMGVRAPPMITALLTFGLLNCRSFVVATGYRRRLRRNRGRDALVRILR